MFLFEDFAAFAQVLITRVGRMTDVAWLFTLYRTQQFLLVLVATND